MSPEYSGTRDFVQTSAKIIDSALRKIGVTLQGGTPSATQYSEATVALNSMVQSWQNRGVFLWTIQTTTIDLVQGEAFCIISSDDILDFQNPRIKNVDVITHLKKLTREDFLLLGPIGSLGIPESIYILKQLTQNVINLFPAPDKSTYKLVIDYVMRLQDFVSATNMPDFPVEWSDALIWGLAFRISHEYGVPIQEREALRREAEQFFIEAFANSREGGSIQFGRKM